MFISQTWLTIISLLAVPSSLTLQVYLSLKMSSQSQTDICECLNLSESDVPALMDILVVVSEKWEEIGIALSLPGNTRSDCRSRNNTLSLTNVISEWIKFNHHQEEITLKKLKLALESPIVGRSLVGQHLVERFTASPRPQGSRSQDSFLPEKKQLTDLYLVCREIPANSWPPVGAATFINLALINKNKRETGHFNYTVRGDMDDILKSKEKVEYGKVFGQYESGALVLIEGRPGSGKTTLVHKVTRDWATTGNVLRNANAVFLIPLRCLAKGNDESLSDILSIFYRHKNDRKKVFSDIRRSNGEGVCFIMDGLDEYHPQNESTSVIYALLQKTYLPKAMVIVASRPVATAILRDEAPVTKQIEVLGFTQQQIFEYIDKFPFSTDVSNLRVYLDSHRNILHMCYLPVHAAMICYLYQHEEGHILPTETKIYEHFTRYIIIRKLRRTNKKALLHSLEDICGENKDYFKKICHLAFNMTIHSKQVVHQCDTEVQLSHDTGPDDAPSLGLITIDRTAQQYGLVDTYTFLHLTFQEYLAAFYLSKLDEGEQMEIVTLYAGEKHMQNVWKFFCGMVSFEGKVAQIQLIMRSALPLYRLQCAFESQQAAVCDHAIKVETGVLSFSETTLTPADLTAVGYAISTTSHLVTELAMARCDLHADHVRVFLREVSNNKLKCILTLNLSGSNIGANGAIALAEALKFCSNLQTLDVSYNNIGTYGATALAEALKFCKSLQILDLRGNNICDVVAATLAEALKTCNNPQTLDLSWNNIGDDGAKALVEALKSCNNLQTLNLSANDIGDDGPMALAEVLKSCNNLLTLDLSYNNIGDDGAAALAEALKSSNNLQTLSLYNNNVGSDGAAALAEALKSCNLQRLDLWANDIGAHGRAALADLKRHIPHCYY